jgi:hypothetical protein
MNDYVKSCDMCGNANYLEVHHRCYAHLGYEARTCLCVLCHGCHRTFHQRRCISSSIECAYNLLPLDRPHFNLEDGEKAFKWLQENPDRYDYVLAEEDLLKAKGFGCPSMVQEDSFMLALMRTMPYSEYLTTNHWQNVRSKMLRIECDPVYDDRSSPHAILLGIR